MRISSTRSPSHPTARRWPAGSIRQEPSIFGMLGPGNRPGFWRAVGAPCGPSPSRPTARHWPAADMSFAGTGAGWCGSGICRERTLELEIPAQPTHKVALSPDGQAVAGTGYTKRAGGQQIDGLVRLWDPRTGELQRTWTIVGDGQTSVGPVAFSPDGRLGGGRRRGGERTKQRKPGEDLPVGRRVEPIGVEAILSRRRRHLPGVHARR